MSLLQQSPLSPPQLSLPPLSLYIHIPWCVRKCPYCDFNSHKAEQILPEADYVSALAADLEAEKPFVQGRKLSSIFIGGGTPSLFSARSIEQILSHAEKTIGFCEGIEITLEANPGTFEQEKFSGFHTAGVNRLSIGVQSFNDLQLQKLGRIHGRNEALLAVDMARKAGFDNINLDLMHGLPEQTTDNALADLQQAIDLAPEHLSWYQLTIEPNTQFYSQPPQLPVEDLLADIQDHGHERLATAGFRQYEVSAYSRGRQSRHNLNYWQFGDYLGIGAGAHGKVTVLSSEGAGAHGKVTVLPSDHEGKILRRRKTRQPNHYLDVDRACLAGDEQISPDKLPLEFLMNALRLIEGVDAELYPQRTGLPLSSLQPYWQQLQAQGLMVKGDQQLQTTPTGQRFLNSVLEGFLG